MGGAVGGGTASALTVNMLGRALLEQGKFISASILERLIKRTNDRIFQTGKEYELLGGMGSTVACLVASEQGVYISHVGDTRIYRLRKGKLDQLTKDHTLMQEMIDSNAISTPSEIYDRVAHVLTRVIGPTGEVEPDSRTIKGGLRAGDVYLIGCDGLSNLVTQEESRQILMESPPDFAADRLVDLANRRGGFDNVTVAVIEISENTSEHRTPYGVKLSVDLQIDSEGNDVSNPNVEANSETPTLLLEDLPELQNAIKEKYYGDDDIPPAIETPAKRQQLVETLNLKGLNLPLGKKPFLTGSRLAILALGSAALTFGILYAGSTLLTSKSKYKEVAKVVEPIEKVLEAEIVADTWPVAPITVDEEIPKLDLAKSTIARLSQKSDVKVPLGEDVEEEHTIEVKIDVPEVQKADAAELKKEVTLVEVKPPVTKVKFSDIPKKSPKVKLSEIKIIREREVFLESEKCLAQYDVLSKHIEYKEERIKKLEVFPQGRLISEKKPYHPINNPTLREALSGHKAKITSLKVKLNSLICRPKDSIWSEL